MGDEEVNVVGAATIPLGFSAVNASIPLARLTIGPDRVTVVLRSVLLTRFLAAFSRDVNRIDRRIGWSVDWADLDRVVASRRSVVMYPKSGRGCRFATRGHQMLRPVVDAIDQHGVPIEWVTTTMTKAFRI